MHTGVPDRGIPFHNIIMRCDAPPRAAVAPLPPGYAFCAYTPGRERDWAWLEHEIGDFTSQEEALAYFRKQYLHDRTALEQRCAFVEETATGRAVATCTAWRDTRAGQPVSSLHWLVAHPSCQGLGLGRAMLQHILRLYAARNEYPVYLHTQPWSYKAIGLYQSMGFCICRHDTFASHPNDYAQAMHVLEGLLPAARYEALLRSAMD